MLAGIILPGSNSPGFPGSSTRFQCPGSVHPWFRRKFFFCFQKYSYIPQWEIFLTDLSDRLVSDRQKRKILYPGRTAPPRRSQPSDVPQSTPAPISGSGFPRISGTCQIHKAHKEHHRQTYKTHRSSPHIFPFLKISTQIFIFLIKKVQRHAVLKIPLQASLYGNLHSVRFAGIYYRIDNRINLDIFRHLQHILLEGPGSY